MVLIGLYAAQAFYLFILNKKHAKQRVAMGGDAKIVDRSMLAVKKGYASKEEVERAQDAGRLAFENHTDFENPYFVYVY